MKVKTSITLSEDMIEAIDRRSSAFKNRSDFIESAIRAFLDNMEKEEREANDLAILNEHADRLNAEASDAMDYQIDP